MTTTKGSAGVPGTGLPAAPYALIVVISVALFMVWGGLLWRAPREASHVARFAVSYVVVIPLAAVALLAVRRLTWAHVTAATGSIWAIKLLVTATLYMVLGRGTNTRLEAAPVSSASLHHAIDAGADYRAASGAFASADLTGRVTRAGAPIAGAVVYLEAPAAGRPLDRATDVELRVAGSRYARPIYVARPRDRALVQNGDAFLHTVHLTSEGATQNQPVPPSPEPLELRLPPPGLFRIGCDNHAGETAWLLVVDHPYVATTDDAGAFRLERVAAGAVRVMAIAAAGGELARGARRVEILSDHPAEVEIQLDNGPHASLSPRQERSR